MQAKTLRDSMTLEDVSHVLMSLKSSGSGQIYSTANLINPSAYMFDVNRLIELQGSVRVPRAQSSSSASSSVSAAAGSVRYNGSGIAQQETSTTTTNTTTCTTTDATNTDDDVSSSVAATATAATGEVSQGGEC
jgi:hypothetical protein